MLPGRTLTTTHNDPSGAKNVKERVTINACSNVTGSIKLPWLFIGKAKNPRCFRMIDQAMPVVYRNQRNDWVDTIIYNDWFQNCFAPDVKKMVTELVTELGLEPRAIFILDNCSAHPSEDELISEDGQIVAKFLPPNVTSSLIQPMDQGVLECLKRIYRKSVLRELLSQTETDMLTFLNKTDILRVIEKIAIAWDQISAEKIRKSWGQLIPIGEASVDENDAYLESVSNDDFVKQFVELNIDIATPGFKLTAQAMNIWMARV